MTKIVGPNRRSNARQRRQLEEEYACDREQEASLQAPEPDGDRIEPRQTAVPEGTVKAPLPEPLEPGTALRMVVTHSLVGVFLFIFFGGLAYLLDMVVQSLHRTQASFHVIAFFSAMEFVLIAADAAVFVTLVIPSTFELLKRLCKR